MIRFAIVLLLASCAVASAGPRLFYSKYFKGSVPEYVAIHVERALSADIDDVKCVEPSRAPAIIRRD